MKLYLRLLVTGICLMGLGAGAQGVDGVRDQGRGGEPEVVAVGGNERVWKVGEGGQVVEMATGMNYWDGQQWTSSEAVFEQTADSFVATRMQHKVELSANLNTPGAVTVITRDGFTLRSTPVAIGLYDTVNGQSMIIGAIRDTEGAQLGDNWVVYRDAFTGVCADVIYRINIGSFEQDVVVTGRLDPRDYGFRPETTRLQIFTEFYDPPQPESVRRPLRIEEDIVVRNGKVTPDFVDDALGFGEFVIATGRAMTMANIADPSAPAAPVGKQFARVDQRTVMIESVELGVVGEDLKNLPDCDQGSASIGKPTKGRLGREYGVVIPTAGSKQQAATHKPTGTTQVVVNKKGLVIDYLASIGGTLSGTQVFKGDTTYFLTNAVTCSGAVTIEAGAIFKFPTNTTSNFKLTGSVVCKASSYRPAIFTAGDDDTVGDKITTNIWSGYTGTINTNGYGNPALWVYNINSSTLSNLRFRYSQEALRVEGLTVTNVLAHSQLINCIKGIVITGSGSGSSAPKISVTGNNNLFAGVTYPVTFSVTPTNTSFVHNTIENTPRVITGSATSATAFTNSIFANVTALYSGSVTLTGDHNGFYNSPGFGTSSNSTGSTPFQSVGAGNYYLVAGSSFRDYGVTNGLSSTVLTDLQKRTTYPPLISTNIYTYSVVIGPQAQRDTDVPDLGYHYDPLDYVISNLTITNATLTLSNGVALASFGTNGIWLKDGSQLISDGTPTTHNHLTRYFNVQEQPTNWGGATLSSMLSVSSYNGNVAAPSAQIRFTDFDGVANSGSHLYTTITNFTYSSLLLKDSSFNSGLLYVDGPTNASFGITNNLFEHVTGYFKDAPQITFYNNLYRYGTLTTTNTSSGTNNWVLKDNAFDSTIITNSTTGLTAAYNAYINMGTNRFSPTNANDRVLTSFTYVAGPLGNFYHSSTNLIDVGSLSDASQRSLYHYTTKTNQTKEATGVLDIGFHYVAVDGNGNPIDTDSDGVPDYLEDWNGNGTVDTGETDWQSAGDLGLRVWITEPKSNSTIP